jgi:asparagine synthase (glutamine-hydrolysing)
VPSAGSENPVASDTVFPSKVCGIVGIVGGAIASDEREALARRMAATLAHRGPDGSGAVADGPCAFGFQRLAIIDLDSDCPPFANEDHTVWSVANAEIYNSDPLRAALEDRGHTFRTGVDTEVLPHLWEERGIELIEQLNGMFAFAVWDGRSRRLLLARDRAGEKPLFYWHGGDELVFASELRALLAHPRVPRLLDPVALRRYLLHDYFPAPLTPFAGVRKLPAGHYLIAQDGEVVVRPYWDLADHYGNAGLVARSPASLAAELDERMALAVERRRRADVPVGVFLSGGIDSSTVLAYMAEQQGPGVPAFSLGHEDAGFDESRFARDTARFFQADFHELVLGEADLADGLERVGRGFDEPLGDASTIPSHLLARFARREVKVVLSGEGADELFAGYPTYLGHRVAAGYQRLPRGLARGAVRALRAVLPVSMGNVGLDYLLERFAAAAEMGLVERHHSWFGSLAPPAQAGVLAPRVLDRLRGDDPFASARARLDGRSFPDDLSRLLYMDFTMYLQDDLLTKVDRATMLASLEARAPFLDHDLAEFVAGLPSRYKLQRLTTKAILRRAVKRRLPPAVLSRRKRGFNIPFSRWLLHGLGDELRRRFSRERVEARGLLSPAGLERLLDDHLSRRADYRKPLFTLLALDLWCDRVFGESAAVPLEDAGEIDVAEIGASA